MLIVFWKNQNTCLLAFGVFYKPVRFPYLFFAATKSMERKNSKVQTLENICGGSEKECVDKLIETGKFELESVFYNAFSDGIKPFIYDDVGNKTSVLSSSLQLQDKHAGKSALNWEHPKYLTPTEFISTLECVSIFFQKTIQYSHICKCPSVTHMIYNLKCACALSKESADYANALALIRKKPGKQVKSLVW